MKDIDQNDISMKDIDQNDISMKEIDQNDISTNYISENPTLVRMVLLRTPFRSDVSQNALLRILGKT